MDFNLNVGGWLGAILAIAISAVALVFFIVPSHSDDAIQYGSWAAIGGLVTCAAIGNIVWAMLASKPKQPANE
jgi:hypothetical protein